MNITWYGTASLGVENEGNRILIDPFFNRNKKLPCATLEDFASYDSILVTHGHYDHIVDIPIIAASNSAMIYCTKTPAQTLIKLGVNADRINVIAPGNSIIINGMRVDIYQSKHVKFDGQTIVKHAVSPSFYARFPFAMKVISTTVTMPEAGEIVGYHIITDDDDAYIMGSMNYDATVKYPKNVNKFILPYNGCSNLPKKALGIVEMFEPKEVYLDHYDNSFPPVTTEINTGKFLSLMQRQHPDIKTECMQFSTAEPAKISAPSFVASESREDVSVATA